MEKQKERLRLLKGIEKEMKNLEKNKDKFPDYENRIAELRKEEEALKKDLN